MASSRTVLRKSHDAILGPAAGPYTHVVEHNGVLYLSGLTAFGSPAQGEPIEAQAREIFRNLGAVAEAEGTSLQNLVKVTLYVTDLSRIAELRSALDDEIFRNLGAVAEAEGTSLQNLVKVIDLAASEFVARRRREFVALRSPQVTLYVTDLSRIAELRSALDDIYGDHVAASVVGSSPKVPMRECGALEAAMTPFQRPRITRRCHSSQVPASSLIRVAGLFSPDIHIEVEAIIARGTGDTS
eukprot:CAMPEP_0185721170 /NCGR_PEP_ID=MMETSP1164-20130828/50482_1 /TAXON_ID=1104430 /ORGANISM="Chrysoreinhardia sp, Strain CCMP2950" /LENGTH=241 /DNA_ID=CAMNT_0028388831 /DNA_START=108 /DNA_END=835 /DNA_ORIENTATION=-